MVHEPSLELVDFGGINLRLTGTHLWVSDELAVPLETIQSAQILKKGWLPKRTALQIVYINPITDALESLAIAKLDFLGLGIYQVEPLEKLREVITTLAASQKSSGEMSAPVEVVPGNVSRGCENCGAEPAFYVGYLFLASAFLFFYRSGSSRRLHCRRCIVKHGTLGYLVTALSGWCGIGIFAYPFSLFQTARNFQPLIGNGFYALVIVPLLCVASFIAWLFLH